MSARARADQREAVGPAGSQDQHQQSLGSNPDFQWKIGILTRILTSLPPPPFSHLFLLHHWALIVLPVAFVVETALWNYNTCVIELTCWMCSIPVTYGTFPGFCECHHCLVPDHFCSSKINPTYLSISLDLAYALQVNTNVLSVSRIFLFWTFHIRRGLCGGKPWTSHFMCRFHLALCLSTSFLFMAEEEILLCDSAVGIN